MANPTQDLLIFVGIPLAVIGLVFALVYASGGRGTKRYRPGRPYPYAPVWFLARPERDGPAAAASAIEAHSSHSGHSGDSGQAALTASEASQPSEASVATVGSSKDTAAKRHPGVTGGASDRW